jgi:hypothetical protein
MEPVRKTLVIELIVLDGQNQRQKREELRAAIADKDHPLRQGLLRLGWSGNPMSCAATVSNPPRTADWPV